MYWFSSDQHFGHENIIKYMNRPFDSIEDMHRGLIERWNDRVKNGDTIYQLGDFSLMSRGRTKEILSRLNGTIKIVPGSHDKWIARADKDSGLVIDPLVTLKFPFGGEKLVIVICHYPLISWEQSNYGSIHLHGHSHGNIGVTNVSNDILPKDEMSKGIRIDVGVDNWGMYPISLEQVMDMGLK